MIHLTGGTKREAEEAGILSSTLKRAVTQIVEELVGPGMCLRDLYASKYCTVAYKRVGIYDFEGSKYKSLCSVTLVWGTQLSPNQTDPPLEMYI